MFEIFEFDFIRRAFITGILIAVIAPCIGVIIVLRRLSMIGDTLSHTSLAGVAAGMVAGFNIISHKNLIIEQFNLTFHRIKLMP
jgi:zinc transport system permease protein